MPCAGQSRCELAGESPAWEALSRSTHYRVLRELGNKAHEAYTERMRAAMQISVKESAPLVRLSSGGRWFGMASRRNRREAKQMASLSFAPPASLSAASIQSSHAKPGSTHCGFQGREATASDLARGVMVKQWVFGLTHSSEEAE